MPAPTSTRQILRLPAVREATGLARSTVYALVARGEFPPQVRLTTRCVGWDAAAVQAWIDARLAPPSQSPDGVHITATAS